VLCLNSELIVVDLDPISIGVLEVDLFDAVRAQLWGLAITGPVAVFDIGLVQVFGKDFQRRDREGEVDIDIMGDVSLGAGYDMQLGMIPELEPDMLAIMEGFRNLF